MNVTIRTNNIIIAFLLIVLGLVGNYLALPIAYGVAFIFGSIFSVMAIVLLGTGWGLLVAIIVASYTFFLWNHPYAVIIFAMEALWLGIALRRGHTNLVIIDAIFWLTLGSLLVAVFYGGIMGLGVKAVLVIILKQSINGLFNTLIASLILYIPATRQQGEHLSPAYTYKNMIFNVIAVFLMIPALSLLLFNNYRENVSLNKQAAINVQTEVQQLEKEVSQWIDKYVNATTTMAQLPSKYGLQPSQSLQEQLAQIKNLFPDFISVYVAKKDATTFGFVPAINDEGKSTIGLNFSDRAYFKALATYGQPIVSDVFIGRGGTTKPIITVSVPVMHDKVLSHFALGAMNVQQMQKIISDNALIASLVITLLDGNGNVIISNDKTRKPIETLAPFTGGRIKTDLANVYLHVPEKSTNVSIMKIGKNSSYFSTTAIPKTNWTLQVEYPLAPMQEQLYTSAIIGLIAVAVLFIPMLFIAFALSSVLTKPIRILASITADLPNQIEGNKKINWPTSNIKEVTKLVDNFQSASHALSNKIVTLNNRLSLAADSAGIGVWDYHVTENTLIWDKWMYTLYGTTEEQFNGAYDAWQNGLHPDDRAWCDHAIQLALNNEKDFNVEFRVLWPTGEVRYIKANAHVQRDENGQAIRMIGINYDITDRKKDMEKLENALKKAEVANDAKSEFLANMSHEIRTPMNGVIGMSNLLLRTPLNEQQLNFAKTVKSSAESLLSIINDILDFSKVEAGKLELEPLDFEIHQLMSELTAIMRFRTEEKGLLLTCPVDTHEQTWLYADAGRVRQILINLVGNAVKFTEQGEIKISYDLQAQENNQTLLTVEIIDSGIGLSDEQQRTLFKRFSQADGSTTRRYGGTGLGLAISKQLVELMDGTIGVSSVLGEGSTFWFTLNLANGKNPTQVLSAETTALAGPNSGADFNVQVLPTFSGKVLVVEDNAINQMVAQCQLEDFGLEVDVADNGKISLEKLENTEYDLVLMDCQMPVMGGFEASSLIRDPHSKVLNHDIPIIAMTANAIKGDREKCIAAGMTDYIPKPVDPETLVRVLTKWLPKV